MTETVPERERLRTFRGTVSGRVKDAVALLVILALSAVFFWRVLFTDEVLVGGDLHEYIPWNQYQVSEPRGAINQDYSDTLLAYLPQILIARQILRSGSLPLWNPYYFSGIPLLASAPWLGLFYPPYIVFYLLDPLKAFGQLAALQLALGGVFMYLYLRCLDCRRLAALVGAVSFGLGGFLLANLAWLPRVSTVIWTPLILLSIENCVGKRKRSYALLGTFAVAMSILAGNTAAVVYVVLVSGLYALFRLVWAWRHSGGRVAVECALLTVGLMCGGGLLSAIQLVPTFEVAAYSGRVHVSYDERIEGGRSPLALATVLVPDVFGNPVDRPWGRNEFGKNIPGTYGETSLYVGIVPLFLAGWAVARKRDGITAFYAGVALLALFIFLDTPLFRLLYEVPLFRIGRQLEAKVMWGLSTSILAAFGMATLLDRPPRLERRALRSAAIGLLVTAIVVVLGVALAAPFLGIHEGNRAAALAADWYRYNVGNFLRLSLLAMACAGLVLVWAHGLLRGTVLALLVLGIAMADLTFFGWKLNPSRTPEGLYPEMDSVRFLQEDESIYRVVRGPLSRKVFPPNSLAVYGVSDVQGYSPVLIDYYVEFLELIEDDIASARVVHSLRYADSTTSPLLDLLNTKYVVTIPQAGEAMTRLEESDPSLRLAYDGEVKIYENRDALPRAFFVPGYVVVRDPAEALNALSSDGFDPRVDVILEKEPALLTPPADAGPVRSQVEVVDYTPNRVVVQANLSTDGFLVLSDLYYQGWRAFVDDVEHEVYKADYALRAVQLKAGKHRIEFVFEPSSFTIGLSVSGVTLLLMVALTAVLIWRRECG
jgi:hypothetical protein